MFATTPTFTVRGPHARTETRACIVSTICHKDMHDTVSLSSAYKQRPSTMEWF